MADTKIENMTDVVTLALGDKFPIADVSALTVNKFATLDEVKALLFAANGLPILTTLTGAYTNSSTTGTEVTGLSFNSLPAGTYYARWLLLMQSAATSTSPKFGVNISANLTRFAANAYFPSAGVTAATGTLHDANNATTGQVWAYANTHTASTTAPNLGPWVGVTNANVDHLLHVDALVVISGTADIELWAGSEVGASQIQLSAGSSGYCIRMN